MTLTTVGRIVGSGVLVFSAASCQSFADPSLDVGFCAVPVANAPTKGPDDAPVTIVEFADFECPYCGRVQATLDRVDAERPDQIRWVFKYLPLIHHAHAQDAAVAAACADEQGLFWEMAAGLFEHQNELSEDTYLAVARSVGLDEESWQECYDTRATLDLVQADYDLAYEMDVPVTPAFFINGHPLLGAAPLADFLDAVDAAREGEQASELEGAEYYDSLVEQGCD